MPRKSKNVRRFRRRRKYTSKIPKQLITNRLTRTLRYNTNVTLNPTAGVPAYHNFAMNGLYDPDITGTGHQPLGWDQLIGVFYDHAVVIGSRIKVEFISTSNTTGGFAVCGIDPRDDTGYALDKDELIEQGRGKHCTIPSYYAGGKTLMHKMNPNKFLGRSAPLADDQLKNSSASNASELAIWTVWAASPDGVIDPTGVIANVTIEYLTVFIEPKTLTGS